MLQSYHQSLLTGTGVNDWWDNWDKQIAFCRGNKGFIAFNDQYNVDLKETLQVRYISCYSTSVYKHEHALSNMQMVSELIIT